MDIKITFSCCMCDEDHNETVQLPNSWGMRGNEVYEEDAFCPEHKLIADWVADQCPGCVGGWQDCPLWKEFAYSGSKGLTNEDYEHIKKGVCPKRVNGTLMVRGDKLEKVDLSEAASTESGEVLAKAIQDYWNKYHGNNPD